MRWTDWKKLADQNTWYNDAVDNEGPACYELGTGGPRRGDIRSHYVGETVNERRRMSQYASHGSHLSAIIDAVLRDGWIMYYRAIACASKREAKRMQDNLLARYQYDWNVQLNGVDDED